MTSQVHIAAQYLATASINFLEKKEDDSHTNLGFNVEKGYLETWPLNDKGCKAAFDYTQFSLHWIVNDTARFSLLLDGKTHKEVVKWMSEVSLALERKEPYMYALHYDLPYEKITSDFTFRKPDEEELKRLLKLRTIAQGAIEEVVRDLNLDTSIRIWPHHFDTGGFISSEGKDNISVGFGMAIPDTLINDFYLYTSGYKGHDGISTGSFDRLSYGHWMNQGFKGAVLPMKNVDEAKAVVFFKESISKYKGL